MLQVVGNYMPNQNQSQYLVFTEWPISGHIIGNAVAFYMEGCGFDSSQNLHRFIPCKWRSWGTAL